MLTDPKERIDLMVFTHENKIDIAYINETKVTEHALYQITKWAACKRGKKIPLVFMKVEPGCACQSD